jgi:hypothetical protein
MISASPVFKNPVFSVRTREYGGEETTANIQETRLHAKEQLGKKHERR